MLPLSSLVQSDSVTFKKASGASVTLTATVSVNGTPTLMPESEDHGFRRPMARTTFNISVAANPGDYLGSPLATNDKAIWGALTLDVIGSAIPQKGSWLVTTQMYS